MFTKYYKLLKEKYKTKEAVLSEIIELESIQQLPKGTEHFLSDLHGEYVSFNHVMRNGSGSIKQKVRDCFGHIEGFDVDDLSVLIYYPTGKLNYERKRKTREELNAWYAEKIDQLVEIANYSGSKYTRSKVRSKMPDEYAFIIEELLTERNPVFNKEDYYNALIQKVIELKQAKKLIRELCILIQHLVVDHVHIVGDIYDRGPHPEKIMDRLMDVPSIDIQWGNHDIAWMATIAGSKVSIMNVIRISARYGAMEVLEEGYGINLRPFAAYAHRHYSPVDTFAPNPDFAAEPMTEEELETLNVMQQASYILQLKLEGQMYHRRPEFMMQDRALLDDVDWEKDKIRIDGKSYYLNDFSAPTVDPKDPNALTQEEEDLLNQLVGAFKQSERLVKHTEFLLEKGSVYLVYNNNLLFHGCIPLHPNGDFKSVRFKGKRYSGRDLLDFYDEQVHEAFKPHSTEDDFATDLLWYLWCGEYSSLFGKHAMKTFERYYIDDKSIHKEIKDEYYELRTKEHICLQILSEFGLGPESHIVNGHTPVKVKDGESPIKANSRLIVIDGGFSKAYQGQTGIAGYTLLSNSYGMQLVAHQPFTGVDEAIEKKQDIISTDYLVDRVDHRTKVRETNNGAVYQERIEDLEYLFKNYDNL